MSETKETLESYGDDIQNLSERIVALKELKKMTENNDVFTQDEVKKIENQLNETESKKQKLTAEFIKKLDLFENNIVKNEEIVNKRTELIDNLYNSCKELQSNTDLMDIFSMQHNFLCKNIKTTQQMI